MGDPSVKEITERHHFKPTLAMLTEKFRGYFAGCHRLREVGVLQNIEYDGSNLNFHVRATGLRRYIGSEEEYKWFTVPNLRKIRLEKPGWGAAVFGAVGLWVTFSGDEEFSVMFASRLNASLRRYRGI